MTAKGSPADFGHARPCLLSPESVTAHSPNQVVRPQRADRLGLLGHHARGLWRGEPSIRDVICGWRESDALVRDKPTASGRATLGRRLCRSGVLLNAIRSCSGESPVGLEKERMRDIESLACARWDCKYHVVFIPKCRRNVLRQTRPQRGLPDVQRPALRGRPKPRPLGVVVYSFPFAA
jgi:hypothetical protein